MRAKYIIGTVIIVVFIIWGASAFLKTTIRYVSIGEAMKASHTVQVMGKIDFDQVAYNSNEGYLRFAIYDAEAEDKNNAEGMKVVYYGVIPSNFEQATSVVLKGKPQGDEFVAEQMLVKCPSKYQGESGEEFQDIKKHNQANGKSGV